MDRILIEAEALTRRYGATLAVSGLNLTLRQGEILGLLGPNGAGKTTAMKMLAGCLAPTAGTIRINGIDLAENPKAAKSALGSLPEQPPVYSELTVDEYLKFCARLHGVASGQRAEALARAKRACGLDEMAQRLIGHLSKGYQQRVGIAQAIIHTPEVIILDEPTVGLDPIQIREIRKLIRDLGNHHSVILSSHILPEVQSVCDRVMIINRGDVVYSESIEAATHSAFETVVVGLRNAPSPDALRLIDGVADARVVDDNQIRIRIAEGADPREAIVAAAVRYGWGLIELRPEVKTLEERFVELTSGDETLKEAA